VLCGCDCVWACGCGRLVLQSSAHVPCLCSTRGTSTATDFLPKALPPAWMHCGGSAVRCSLDGSSGHLLWFCGRLALPLHTSCANCASHKAALFCGTRFWPPFPFLFVSESVYEKGRHDAQCWLCMQLVVRTGALQQLPDCFCGLPSCKLLRCLLLHHVLRRAGTRPVLFLLICPSAGVQCCCLVLSRLACSPPVAAHDLLVARIHFARPHCLAGRSGDVWCTVLCPTTSAAFCSLSAEDVLRGFGRVIQG
jgi:hypothetical protein